MTHEQRSKAANQQDPKWAAKVVRNIGQIEADFFHAAGPVSERIMAEAFLALQKAVTPPWELIENEWASQVVCPDWKMARGVGVGDAWLEVAEISADEEGYEHTWLAAMAQTGPTLLGIQLMFRRGLMDYAETILRDDKAVAPLWEKGWARDETSAALFMPIFSPAEKIAQAFEQNDLTGAVAPFAKALTDALAAKSELDKLVAKVRAAAKSQ